MQRHNSVFHWTAKEGDAARLQDNHELGRQRRDSCPCRDEAVASSPRRPTTRSCRGANSRPKAASCISRRRTGRNHAALSMLIRRRLHCPAIAGDRAIGSHESVAGHNNRNASPRRLHRLLGLSPLSADSVRSRRRYGVSPAGIARSAFQTAICAGEPRRSSVKPVPTCGASTRAVAFATVCAKPV
jgi:hypothetical protein